MGICPVTGENRIIWDIRLLEEHGVENYPFNGLSVDILCKARATQTEEPVVTVRCEKPFTVQIRYGNKSKVIRTT